MKINPGNARGLLVPQGDRPFSFVVYSSEIRDFGEKIKKIITFFMDVQIGTVKEALQNPHL